MGGRWLEGDYPCLGGSMAKYSYSSSWRRRTLPAGPATPFIVVVSSRRRARDDALRKDGRSSSDCGWNPFPLSSCRATTTMGRPPPSPPPVNTEPFS